MTRNVFLFLLTIKSEFIAVWQNDITACHTCYSHNQLWLVPCMEIQICACVCQYKLDPDVFGWFRLSTLVHTIDPRCQNQWPLSALLLSLLSIQTSIRLPSHSLQPLLIYRREKQRTSDHLRSRIKIFSKFASYLNMCLGTQMHHQLDCWPPLCLRYLRLAIKNKPLTSQDCLLPPTQITSHLLSSFSVIIFCVKGRMWGMEHFSIWHFTAYEIN